MKKESNFVCVWLSRCGFLRGTFICKHIFHFFNRGVKSRRKPTGLSVTSTLSRGSAACGGSVTSKSRSSRANINWPLEGVNNFAVSTQSDHTLASQIDAQCTLVGHCRICKQHHQSERKNQGSNTVRRRMHRVSQRLYRRTEQIS